MPVRLPTRLPLSGRSPRRLPFERRLRLGLLAWAVPGLVLAGMMVYERTGSRLFTLLALLPLSLAALMAAAALFEQIIRPLQTLTNVVAALRDEDFSFRARGARRGDSLGDLALEVNVLASSLQRQRSSALDALSLVQLVLNSMQSPVLAFDGESRLHLLNPAAERAFGLSRQHALGRPAAALGLLALIATPDEGLYQTGPVADQTGATHGGARPALPAGSPQPERWSVRRTTFRLHGVPHSLFVLTDVAAALREEERLAWQRLIRVLGHEINNSLTPIKSIAGSLRSRLPQTLAVSQPVAAATPGRGAPPHQGDMDRGLAVIEDRADSLNRFLQAYQRLSRLPPPALAPTPLLPLLLRVVQMETRLPVRLEGGPELVLLADSDQLQQLLINLVRNAADSALAAETQAPEVQIAWTAAVGGAVLRILDNGTGLANPANLFVPFYTTKPGGTGIGLVLAQQIATAHRGSVALRNREATAGCEAEVRLPLWRAPEQPSLYAVS